MHESAHEHHLVAHIHAPEPLRQHGFARAEAAGHHAGARQQGVGVNDEGPLSVRNGEHPTYFFGEEDVNNVLLSYF